MSINSDVKEIKSLLLKRTPPEHFGAKDAVLAGLGALVLGLTFIFKGLLFQVSISLTPRHVFFIVIATALILTGEIYWVGYSRVQNKSRRPFLQFWAKRFFAFYGISIVVSFSLVYLYGLDILVGSFANALKVVVAVSFPSAVGTALSDLMR